MRQVSGQLPRCFIPSLFGICGSHNRPPLSSGTVWSNIHLQSPPLLLMTIPKTPHYLRPISWVALTFPSFAGRHSCFPRRTYLAYSVPPGVRGLQGHNVAHPKLAQRPFETLILTVERVGHHRTKRDAIFSLVRNSGSSLPPPKWWAGV